MIDDNDDNDEINIFNLMLALTIMRAEYNKYTLYLSSRNDNSPHVM